MLDESAKHEVNYDGRTHESTEEDHADPGDGQGDLIAGQKCQCLAKVDKVYPFDLLSKKVTEGDQEASSENKTDVARQRECQLLSSRSVWRDPEDIDHRWVYDVGRVVCHGDDESDDEGSV